MGPWQLLEIDLPGDGQLEFPIYWRSEINGNNGGGIILSLSVEF